MGLVKRLEHLKVDHREIAQEKGPKEVVAALGQHHDCQAPRDEKRDDMAPARAARAVVERKQDLGRLPAVQRPDRQEVDQAPEQIDLNQEPIGIEGETLTPPGNRCSAELRTSPVPEVRPEHDLAHAQVFRGREAE